MEDTALEAGHEIPLANLLSSRLNLSSLAATSDDTEGGDDQEPRL